MGLTSVSEEGAVDKHVLRAITQPLLGDAIPFVFAFPATVLVALLWGTLPGMATAGVCALADWFPNVPPNIPDSQQTVQFGWFAASSIFTSVLCRRLRGSHPFEARPVAQFWRETSLSTWLQAVLWGVLLLPLCAQRADQASQIPNEVARAHDAEIHVRLSDMAAGINAVVNANVWTASGSLLSRSDHYPVDPDLTIADRGYFRRLRADPLPVAISEVMRGRQSGKQVMSVGIRRHTPDGSFNGIVTVTLAPSFFSDYYQSLAHEDPMLATFALVRNDGATSHHRCRWRTWNVGEPW